MADQPTITYEKPWVDHDLQDPLISDAPQTPRRFTLLENRFADKLITAANIMLNTPIIIFSGTLMTLDATFFFLLKYNVIDLGSSDLNNEWMNLSIQIFMGFFTYICISTFPREFRNVFRLYQMKVSDIPVGTNWEGQTSSKFFDYFPIVGRICITFAIVNMCILQFLNQGTRLKYYSYTLASEHEFDIKIANICFGASITSGVFALLYTLCLYILLKMSGREPTGNEGSSSSSLSSPPLAI